MLPGIGYRYSYLREFREWAFRPMPQIDIRPEENIHGELMEIWIDKVNGKHYSFLRISHDMNYVQYRMAREQLGVQKSFKDSIDLYFLCDDDDDDDDERRIVCRIGKPLLDTGLLTLETNNYTVFVSQNLHTQEFKQAIQSLCRLQIENILFCNYASRTI